MGGDFPPLKPLQNKDKPMKISEILENLKKPVPKQYLSAKTIKGNKITYIAWYDLAEILDNTAGIGQWDWEIKDISQIGDNLTLIGSLTIYGSDRQLTMMATGTESINCSGYGDPSSNAEAMAMRRCCAKFGLGRDLWRKDEIKQPSLPNIPHKGQITREQWLARRQAVAVGSEAEHWS
jgi:hypothetical protein